MANAVRSADDLEYEQPLIYDNGEGPGTGRYVRAKVVFLRHSWIGGGVIRIVKIQECGIHSSIAEGDEVYVRISTLSTT